MNTRPRHEGLLASRNVWRGSVPIKGLLSYAVLVAVVWTLAPAAALGDTGPQYGSIGQYGEMWRGGGFDAAAWDRGKYDGPLTPGKFIDPIGFTVDTHDLSTADGTAIYVLDRTSNLPGNVTGGTTSWRLQKLDDTGAVLGTDHFSLPADANSYEMLGLAVDPGAGRVYALVNAISTKFGFEYVDEILAWSTTPDGGALVKPAALGTDALSAGLSGDSTPGVLSPFSSLSKKNGQPAVIAPEGLALDISGAEHFLAVQSADDSGAGDASGIAQISADTGAATKQWSSRALDGLPNGFGESSNGPAGITTAPDGSLTILLDEETGQTPSNIDVIEVPASLTGKAKVLSSAAIAVENPDLGSLANDDAAIFTSDVLPQTPDTDGKTASTRLASAQIVALSNGLYAGDFEPEAAGAPDPQSPGGNQGMWTAHTPGVRLLQPLSDGTVSTPTPPLASLFDTLGNPTANTTGETGAASACSLLDETTSSAGNDAGPFPSLAAGAGGAVWVLTRGIDSSGGTASTFQGGRELIELAPGGAGEPCPGASGTFSVSANGGDPQPASTTSPLTIGAGTQVGFDGSTITYNGAATEAYAWEFGDGDATTTFGPDSAPFTWPSPTASETYTTTGTYTVTLKLFGDYGEYDQTGTIHVVPGSVPHASFTYTPASPHAGAAISFDGSNSTPSSGADTVDYQWNWGDGTIDETPSPTDSHTFALPGTYAVKLTVRDSRYGVSKPTTERVLVAPAPPPPLQPTTTTTELPPPPLIGAPDMSARIATKPSSSGKVKVLLACPVGQTSCSGTVLLQTAGKHPKTLGKATFTIAGGKSASVDIKLSRRTLAALKRSRSIKLTAAVQAGNPQGESATTYQRLTLHRAQPRKQRRKPRRPKHKATTVG